MPILERDALQARTLLSQKGEELGAERAAGLARILSEFKAQQERNGEALFPSEERQKRERATALRRLFQDRERHGLDKGAFEQLQTEAGKTLDPEATRYRAINRQFFADLTGETPEALIPQYDSLRDAYARKQWGMEKTSDKAFFSRLADEFDREEDVLTKASKAAIGDSLNGQRDWMRAYSAAGFDENAFPDKFQAWEWREKFRLAYDQTEAETAHFAPEAKAFVDALQRSMTGGATDGDDAILSGFRERLIDAPKDERDSMLRAITVYGATVGESVVKGDAGGANALAPAKTAVDGWFQQAGESAARIIKGMATDTFTAELAVDSVAISGALPVKGTIDTPEKARAFLLEQAGAYVQNTRGDIGPTPSTVRPAGETRELTAEETALLQNEQGRMKRGIAIAREIEQIAQSTDPIKSVTASTLGSSLAIMTPLMVSPSSAIVIAKGYSNLEYNQLRLKEPDMSASDAAIISLTSGAVQAALDLTGVKALKALPSVRLLFEGKATRELAKRAIIQTGKVYAFENVIEGAQDAATPILQGLWGALEKDVPLVNWEAEKKHWIGTRADVAIGMLPLTLIGTGVSTVSDVRNSRRLLANASLLEASGLGRDIAVEVADLAATGRVEEAGRVLASAWQSRSAASAEAFAEIEADQQQRMDAFTRLSEAGILPGMRRTNEGWALTFQDGTLTEFGSHTDADAARWEYASNQSLSVAEEMRRTITDLERQLEPGREIVYEFSPERMDTARAEAEGLASREALQQRVDVGRALAGEFSEAQDAARVASVDAESAQAIVPILGMNQSQWVEGIQRTVIKLYQGASPLTLVEEKLEADVSRMMKTGRAPWLIAALREYERVSGDTLFRKGVADDQLEGTDIREAYSHLGTSYFVGKSRRENSPALTAKGFRKLAADMMRTKLGGVLTAYGHFFRSVFRRAAKLRSLTKDGKLNPELEAELARSLGIGDEQQEQVAQEKEAERLAMELRNAVQERDTTHRVFEGGTPLAIKSGLGVLDARDPNLAFRITGKSQIEDMVSSGQVRAREGKMRGGRTGETQWSRGHKSLGYRALGNSGRFVIVAKLEGLHQRRGGLPVSDVAEIWQEENGTWINVTSQIKEKAAENEATELADTLQYNPSDDAPFSMLIAPGNSQKIEEVSFGEIFKTEEIEGDISALSELEAISKRFGLPRPLDAANILENWVRIGIAEQQGATEEDAVEARKLVTRYKGETISPPEVDEFYYHVTTKKNAKAIFKSGEIKPGQSGQFSTAATRSNSHGRVFVSERGGVQFWVDRIQEQLDDRESREKLTVLRIPKAFVIDPKADNALELRGDSFYTESPISTKDAPFSMLVEEAGFSALVSPENPKAESISGIPATEIFKSAKDKFGVTRSIYEAGYVLPDGSMLDFSGRSQVGDFEKRNGTFVIKPGIGRDWMQDQRGVDHREIEWDGMPEYSERWGAMVDFLRLGAVRIDGNSGMISMHSRAPITSAQSRILKDLVTSADGAYLDLEDDAGNRSAFSIESGKWGKVNGFLTRWANGETPDYEGVSFSALPRNVASDPQDFEARLARMFDPFQRSPELRQQIGLLAQQRAIEAIRKWQPIAAIAGRTKADIDRERKARIESGIADRVAALDQSVFEALAIPDELLDPRDYPVFDKLLRRKTYKRKDGKTVGYWAGMLESPSAYMKRTGKARAADEYDGMGDLPTWVFGGSLTPDEAADMVGVDGTNALWDEIHRSIDSARLRTQERATAQAEVDRIESEARAEANEWAAREEARLDSVSTQRENLTGAIRTLNAMISALPPEVRGKIGGFVTLSKKVGPAALLRELMDRAGKMESELEVWLRKDIDRQVFKLLEKAKPAKDKAGKKKVGKAGADIHALFDEIRAAIRMDATEAEAQAVALETKAMADNATAEQEAHYTLAASMVRLFGDWRNADAARRSAAHDAAKATWEKGYLEWQTKKRLEREQREEIRQALIVATGSSGTAGERDKRMNADNGFRGFLRKAGLNLLPFEGVLRYAFGDASPEAQRLADMEREASNQKDDAMFAAMGEVDDLFAGMAGGRLAGAKLRFELAQKSVTVGERTMSQLEMLQAVLMWRQPDGQRHMIGQLDETGKPVGAWHYGPEFMAEVEAKLSSEAREVLAFISDRYAAEWETLNPIYAELNGVNLPRNANYAPLTVKPMTASAGDMVDPVTGSASSSRSSTPGSLRSRGVAIAEPDFRDALQTYVAHRKQMEHWKAYARFSRDARAVLGNRNVSNSVSAINQEAATVLKNWIDDIEAGGNRDAAAHLTLSQGISGMTNRAAAMGVVGRIGTIALQSSQLMAGRAEMPPMAFWSRFGALMAGRLDWRAALRSDYIQRRIKQMPPIVQQAMEGFESGKPNAVKYAARQLAKTIPGADGFFTAGTFAIVLDYQRSQLLKSGFPAAEAERRALAAAERITDRVAQPTRLGARSVWENRAGGMMRLVWAFSSEARKNVGIMLGAIMRGNVAETARGIGYVVVLNGIVSQFIRSAMRDLRDDDDEDLFDEKHWNPSRLGLAVLTDWLYGIPVIGDQLERAAYKLAGEYVPEGSLFREIQGAIPALYRLDELAAGELESEEALRDLETIVTAMGYFNDTLAGAASFAHLIRDAAGIAENVEGPN